MSGIIKPPFGAQLNLDHPLARGMVGCWLFNEGSGNKAQDYSGQGNIGTLTNFNDPPIATSGWNAGPHGGALAFDGSNDYVDFGAMPLATISPKAFTLEIILKPDDNSVDLIIDHGTAYNQSPFYVAKQLTTFEFEVWGGSTQDKVNTLSTYSIGQWYHLWFVWESTKNINIFLNGKIDNGARTSNPQTTLIPGDANLMLGRRPASASLWYTGAINLFRYYNRALSAEEIAYL